MEDLYCQSGLGGKCHLVKPCSEYLDTNLFTLYFKVKFAGAPEYTIVPLAMFMNSTGHACDIFVQSINSTTSDPSRVVLGSMFLQAFNALYTNTLQPGGRYKTELSLSLSS
jgi:hypothetical protein